MTQPSLEGKVAIVTGSSRSIGASIARTLAADGANVVVNYVTDESAAEIVVADILADGHGNAVSVQADLSSMAGAQHLLDETVAAFGRVDILVLNAAVMEMGTLGQIDDKSFDKHMDINVKGPLFLTKLAAPLLPAGGRVVFLSTSWTRASHVIPAALLYVATKGAIEQLARALAKELGAREITVNTVSPGPTNTELFRSNRTDEMLQAVANTVPAKRIGKPEEVSEVIRFLVSGGAAWVNGQNILVNGVRRIAMTSDRFL
ncbi:NAD(P)-binding protein [Auriscalpium vulgare]|uniref:NAD(P)-binding protein n=1 Tax=Auriscalpium vulgare TaxID=40419 RepID=A0ACB8S183_9AGAM|nr:NAD(P)-binding protein [Auriscalpium vulgare]